jgi:hypothetical protein
MDGSATRPYNPSPGQHLGKLERSKQRPYRFNRKEPPGRRRYKFNLAT